MALLKAWVWARRFSSLPAVALARCSNLSLTALLNFVIWPARLSVDCSRVFVMTVWASVTAASSSVLVPLMAFDRLVWALLS